MIPEKLNMLKSFYNYLVDELVLGYFKKNPVEKGDIILVQGHKVEPKKKMVDGKFVSVPGTSERWITQYKKVEKI